jgi:hypothetical protein
MTREEEIVVTRNVAVRIQIRGSSDTVQLGSFSLGLFPFFVG